MPAKGRVERTIRYLRDNYLQARPLTDLDSMNEGLRSWCDKIGNKRPWPDNRSLSVQEIWRGERAKLLALPKERRHPTLQESRRATKSLWVHFDLNTYSIPVAQLGHPLLLEADDRSVTLYDAGKIVVRHPRSYDRGHFVEAKEHRNEISEHRQFGRTNMFREQIVRDFPQAERILSHLFMLGHDAGTSVKRLCELRIHYGDELFGKAASYLAAQDRPTIEGLRLYLNQLETQAKRLPGVELTLPNNPKVKDLVVKSHPLADYDQLF